MFNEISNNIHYKLMVLLTTEFIADSQKEEILNLMNDADLNILYNCCREHEMDSIAYPSLSKIYKGEIPEIWKENYLKTKERIGSMIRKLKEVAEKFDKSGIPIVALKNGGIASAFMDDMAKCPMGDIDTLVKKEDFIEAHKILIDMGFKFKFRSEYEFEDIEQSYIDGGTEYYFENHGNGEKIWFELSWRPISGRWIRLDKEPKADELIKNSIFAKDSKIMILSPEDNLLQVAVHTAKHSYVREPGFRLHLDVERVVKHSEINWEVFVEKVKITGVKTAAYYSLYIASMIFQTPVPKDVLKELKPNKLKDLFITKILTKAQLLHPSPKKFSKIEFVFFQVLLYDNLFDLCRVVLPSVDWLKNKYGFKSSLLIPFYMILRVLDLVGTRKSKNK